MTAGCFMTFCARTWCSGWTFRCFVWARRSPLSLSGASVSRSMWYCSYLITLDRQEALACRAHGRRLQTGPLPADPTAVSSLIKNRGDDTAHQILSTIPHIPVHPQDIMSALLGTRPPQAG